jgi:hypothetical protein
MDHTFDNIDHAAYNMHLPHWLEPPAHCNPVLNIDNLVNKVPCFFFCVFPTPPHPPFVLDRLLPIYDVGFKNERAYYP